MAQEVSIVIPCHDAKYLHGVLRSIQRQTLRPECVVVVDDGANINSNEYAGSIVVKNENGMGKVQSIYKGLESVETDLVLLLDSDTFLERRCLERLMKHLVGDIAVTTAEVTPANLDGWIGSCRLKLYDPNLKIIHGCCFLTKKDLLYEIRLNENSLAEDEEFTDALSGSDYMWLSVKRARVYTIEPETWSQLIKQQVRWFYGFFQLEAKRKVWFKARPYTNLMAFTGLIAPPTFTGAVLIVLGADILFSLILISIFYAIALGATFVLNVIQTMKWLGYGQREFKYALAQLVSQLSANLRFLFHRKPKWY